LLALKILNPRLFARAPTTAANFLNQIKSITGEDIKKLPVINLVDVEFTCSWCTKRITQEKTALALHCKHLVCSDCSTSDWEPVPECWNCSQQDAEEFSQEIEPSAKFEEVKKILLDTGENVLIFSFFTSGLNLLYSFLKEQQCLKGRQLFIITGNYSYYHL
jgi:hypothetical protein